MISKSDINLEIVWVYGGFVFCRPGSYKYRIAICLETSQVVDIDFRTFKILEIQAKTTHELTYAYALYLAINTNYYFITSHEILDYKTYKSKYYDYQLQ